MLSRRHSRHSWAFGNRHQNAGSMFHMLAEHWRPVAAELRNGEHCDDSSERHQTEDHKTLPPCWSPWLLIK
jgi:hypothetical protein